MKVTDTERFLHYRVQALENKLNESEEEIKYLQEKLKTMKHSKN
jgi:chaperonin cofactor prefoldin